MKTQSNNMPLSFRTRGNSIFFSDNIESYTKINETTEEEETFYSYDEYEVILTSRENLEEYVSSNFDVLFKFAKEKFLIDKLLPTKEEVEQAELEVKVLTILEGVL